MNQRKPTRSDQDVAVKPWWFHVEQRERRAGRVGLRPPGEASSGHLRPYFQSP